MCIYGHSSLWRCCLKSKWLLCFLSRTTGGTEGPVAPLPASLSQDGSGPCGCSPSGSCRRHDGPAARPATAAAWHEASHAWLGDNCFLTHTGVSKVQRNLLRGPCPDLESSFSNPCQLRASPVYNGHDVRYELTAQTGLWSAACIWSRGTRSNAQCSLSLCL